MTKENIVAIYQKKVKYSIAFLTHSLTIDMPLMHIFLYAYHFANLKRRIKNGNGNE